MLPLNSIIKNAFDKFDQDFQTANLPEGKYIQSPPSTVKWYQLGQSCYEDKIQELNTDFAKICISPKSSGLLWSRFLFQFLNNWNIRQDRIFPLSILPHCIQSLLSKNVIERVENVKSLGFYNRLFLVPMLHHGRGQL